MRALIVDDSRFVRGFLRGLLEAKGNRVRGGWRWPGGPGSAAQWRALRPGAAGLEHAGDERL